MILKFSLSNGANSLILWEGEVDVKPQPSTEAACSSFTAAGLAMATALALQSAYRIHTKTFGYSPPFALGEILAASWVWSPRDARPVLSIVTRNDVDGFRSYLGTIVDHGAGASFRGLG